MQEGAEGEEDWVDAAGRWNTNVGLDCKENFSCERSIHILASIDSTSLYEQKTIYLVSVATAVVEIQPFCYGGG